MITAEIRIQIEQIETDAQHAQDGVQVALCQIVLEGRVRDENWHALTDGQQDKLASIAMTERKWDEGMALQALGLPVIRHGSFGPIVWVGGETRAADQRDLDTLPVGSDLTEAEEASIEE